MLNFEHPAIALLCAAISVVAIMIARRRRGREITFAARAALITSMALLTLSAGGLRISFTRAPSIAIMIDCSGSTRTSRARDLEVLIPRLRQLLLDRTTIDLIRFAESNQPAEKYSLLRAPTRPTTMPDLPGERTIFSPPDAEAIVLCSDGQFRLPEHAPPVFALIDPALDAPDDAAIRDLQLRPGDGALEVVASSRARRTLHIVSRDATQRDFEVGPGTVIEQIAAGVSDSKQLDVTARFDPADAWPENDALTIHSPPPERSQRWWIGTQTPPGWRQIENAAQLPKLPSDYVNVRAIVLNNLSADSISAATQFLLSKYVRDLGGTLIINGGAHAFAAGDYVGTTLDALSPLASAPPLPKQQWIFLVDASGSMATAGTNVDHESRWQRAIEAVRSTIAHLPPNDLVSVASFAGDLRWWVSPAVSVTDLRSAPLQPPRDVAPNGPTNLEASLSRIVSEIPSTLPAKLLIVTDADAAIRDVDALAVRFASANCAVHILSTQSIARDSSLAAFARQTGGSIRGTANAAALPNALIELSRVASPSAISTDATKVHFDASLQLSDRDLQLTNRVWQKNGTTPIARDDSHPLAAVQRVGLGEVVAIAFPPTPAEIESITQHFEQAASDPRFDVTWQKGATNRVRVVATDANGAMNGLAIELNTENSPARSLAQNAPGEYTIEFPSAPLPRFATLTTGGKIVSQSAIPNRYAAEFEQIGNNRENLQRLCDQSGGRLIEPNDPRPLELPKISYSKSLVSLTAIVGAIFLATALWSFRKTI